MATARLELDLWLRERESRHPEVTAEQVGEPALPWNLFGTDV